MSMRERREYLATLQREGWLSAELDDTPRFIARRGNDIGWGYSREAAIADLTTWRHTIPTITDFVETAIKVNGVTGWRSTRDYGLGE